RARPRQLRRRREGARRHPRPRGARAAGLCVRRRARGSRHRGPPPVPPTSLGGAVVIFAVTLSAAMLAVAAIFALVRAEKGPSMLDRTVAFDVFTTTLVAAVALEAAWSRRTDTLVLLVVLSLVGFVGSVTISRFAAMEPEEAARVRTREEVEAELAAERAAEEAAVEAEQARREAMRAEAREAVRA